ncbi:MAG: tRNA1Val (adenine37-N6)-methyltransferase [Acidobacteriota bacterium]|jgi:tRNA1(Val) A37 N6-methylase TrmN6|nr:tRNA1Val (adenine37-N6)-methyltransferase [Acidobacteriota bacterium]
MIRPPAGVRIDYGTAAMRRRISAIIDRMTSPARFYRGWRRPGPVPPGGVEPDEGETLDYICGDFRIFQYANGHRYSTDDVLTAWYATVCAPRVDRAADLGSGIGSVALIVAWRLPGARMFTVEAQSISAKLARKTMQYNGIDERVTIYEGDLRDASILANDAPFDLVTGSPPYFPPGTAAHPAHPQAVPARNEVRGSVAGYAATAAKILAPGGVFVFVFPTAQADRAMESLSANDLALLRRRDVVFKEGREPLISLFCAMHRADFPPRTPFIEPPLTIRSADGGVTEEYAAVRMSFGFPPGDVAGE